MSWDRPGQLCDEVWSLDGVQHHASGRAIAADVPASGAVGESRALHGGDDGGHCVCGRHGEAGEIFVLGRTPVGRGLCGSGQWVRPAFTACDGWNGVNVDREGVVVWWIGRIWRVHALRYAKDTASCEDGEGRLYEEGCGE